MIHDARYSDLKMVKELLYDKCGFVMTHLNLYRESVAYGACSFSLEGYKIEHRISKITPAKTGQFVTIWKRNENGVTEPFDISDDFDFIAVTSKNGAHIGQFIFPKSVLADKAILSQKGKGGKRGLRVYPNWDKVVNKQAEKTQGWQAAYFVSIVHNNSADIDLAKQIFDKTNLNCLF